MRSRRAGVLVWLIPAGFAVATLVVLWHGLVTLPHEYDALQERGVAVPVRVLECGPGVGGDSHGFGCRLETDVRGRVHRWRVDSDVRRQAAPDGTVAGLVDPRDPGRSALASDVRRRSGTGTAPWVLAGLFGSLSALTGFAAWWTRRPERS